MPMPWHKRYPESFLKFFKRTPSSPLFFVRLSVCLYQNFSKFSAPAPRTAAPVGRGLATDSIRRFFAFAAILVRSARYCHTNRVFSAVRPAGRHFGFLGFRPK